MRLNKHLSRKKILTAVSIVLVAGTVGVALAAKLNNDDPTPDTSSTNTPVATERQDTKANTPEQTNDEAAQSGRTAQEVPAGTFTVQINTLSQSDGSVSISGSVFGAGEGSCVVNFKRDSDKPVVRQAKGAVYESGAQCGPITIPEVEFTSLGEWNATLEYFTANGKASATKSITIR